MKYTPRDLFVTRTADFSPCRNYRYSLTIIWDASLPLAGFIGLNPSTADEFADDPTLRRERGFAASWGCGGLVKLNAFAWRATLPRDMLRQSDPVGPRNTPSYMREALARCSGPKVACWGTHAKHMDRGATLARELPGLHCFGTNADGSPKHPLYLAGSTALIPYPEQQE